MKPKVCIVTTPNRDFNALFDYLENLNPAGEKSQTYRRDGVLYRMRHHDHRFEWTRHEFRKWGLEAAKKYGYDVQFTGVGGLGRGMSIRGRENADEVLLTAASTYKPEEFPSGEATWDRLKEIVCPVDDNDEGISEIRKAFGDCSQMAVFVIKPEMDEEPESVTPPSSVEDDGLKLIHCHEYPYVKDEAFPPSLKTVLQYLMDHGRLMHLLPDLIVEEWAKDDKQVLKDFLHWREHGGVGNLRGDVWGMKRWTDLDDESLRKRGHLFARLAGRTWEVKCCEVVVTAEQLWEASYELKRACHFDYNVFLTIISQIKATGDGKLLEKVLFSLLTAHSPSNHRRHHHYQGI
jgi:hypothetical protein